jgi:hypothetical protein
VTLVCLYLACWIPTNKKAIYDLRFRLGNHTVARVIAPLVVAFDEYGPQNVATPPGQQLMVQTQYYLWFFGWTAKLPVSTDWRPVSKFPIGPILQRPEMPADFYEQGMRS